MPGANVKTTRRYPVNHQVLKLAKLATADGKTPCCRGCVIFSTRPLIRKITTSVIILVLNTKTVDPDCRNKLHQLVELKLGEMEKFVAGCIFLQFLCHLNATFLHIDCNCSAIVICNSPVNHP